MIGWAMLALLALATAALLFAIGFPRRLWAFAASALMLGAAGYAWQGQPDLPGAPRAEHETQTPRELDAGLIEMRDAMYGVANYSHAYFVASDAMERRGNDAAALNVMLGAVRTRPQDGSLWAGLGLALARRDGGMVSPPAELAFDRAVALWPKHPGPAFFRGLAYVRAGDLEKARRWWRRALALTTSDTSYRETIAEQLMLLDRVIALRAAARRGELPQAPMRPPKAAAPR